MRDLEVPKHECGRTLCPWELSSPMPFSTQAGGGRANAGFYATFCFCNRGLPAMVVGSQDLRQSLAPCRGACAIALPREPHSTREIVLLGVHGPGLLHVVSSLGARACSTFWNRLGCCHPSLTPSPRPCVKRCPPTFVWRLSEALQICGPMHASIVAGGLRRISACAWQRAKPPRQIHCEVAALKHQAKVPIFTNGHGGCARKEWYTLAETCAHSCCIVRC